MMKKKYLSDYEVVKENNKSIVKYTGPYYRLDISDRQYKHAKMRFCCHGVSFIVLFIAMGLINNDGMRQFYIGLPYAFILIAAAFTVYDSARFILEKPDMERMRYEGSFLRLLAGTVWLIILSAVITAGDTAYFLLSADKHANEWLFIFFSALMLASAWYFFKFLRTIKELIVIRND